MKRILAPGLAFGLIAALAAPAAFGDRHIIGSDDDAVVDAGPAPTAPVAPVDPKKDPKKDDKKKPGDKKADDKKPDAKADDKKPDAKADDKKPDAKADDKKPDDKKPDAKAVKKDDKKVDVLEDTAAEKAARAKEKDAKDKADQAADEATKKKEAEQKKLLEEKKAADAKKKVENKDQRLAAAKKIRQFTRLQGVVLATFAVEPGYVQSNGVLEVRVDLGEKLDVADPRYGNFMPLKGLDLVAVVSAPGKGQRERYVLHPLDAAGRYGFHTTPLKDGSYQVSIEGTTKDNKAVSASFPLHVGAWPPPDFDDEEKNNATISQKKTGGEN